MVNVTVQICVERTREMSYFDQPTELEDEIGFEQDEGMSRVTPFLLPETFCMLSACPC